ncbi:uncharacterized protein LOC123315041 [Coccinella septempunctata]|uniref:uncharacterized protein LOC123315041 n=1 Tax=Coccinella septempunctata TaxID=41139 RepID=UPI001D097881|nr:uncharacterized protein LOC123315041 [Coccinella septempunctata]
MCNVVSVNPRALPLFIAVLALTISIFFEGKSTSEAFPTMRFERSVDDGPLHGSDFLSLLMDPQTPQKPTPEPLETSTETRIPRSTRNQHPYTSTIRKIRPTVGNLFKIDRSNRLTSENSDSEGYVLAVRVSSSVGKTLINKDVRQGSYEQEKNDLGDATVSNPWGSTVKPLPNLSGVPNNLTDEAEDHSSTVIDDNQVADVIDQISIASEDHPSLIAESNKNEFNIEEKEPITTDSEASQTAYVEAPPRLPDFNPPEDLLKQGQSQTKVHPYQQTIIFHNTGDANQARSVSYSSVAQGVTSLRDKWQNQKPKTHDRQERHYDETKNINTFRNSDKGKMAESQTQYPLTETTRKPWSRSHIDTPTTPKFSERNWESPEKNYAPRPTQGPYSAQPEQNYEVDESVSVVTNGRVHGVQPKPNPDTKKKDDNQKVGYVVEGRNYRKYRVEERTSDGFIVGEYGVVSHDDGSLRGVRYTADGTINPRLIYDALMKFLSL